MWLSVIVRRLTIACLLLRPTKTALARQPENCHIHPDWNSNGSPSPRSILHDNDVVTFGEEIVCVCVCVGGLCLQCPWRNRVGSCQVYVSTYVPLNMLKPSSLQMLFGQLISCPSSSVAFCQNCQLHLIFPSKLRMTHSAICFPVDHQGNQISFDVQHCSDLVQVDELKK